MAWDLRLTFDGRLQLRLYAKFAKDFMQLIF